MPKSANRGKRNKHRRAIREVYEAFGPDASTTVHTFPDGWTIRRLATPADEFIEGALMHHCLGEDTWLEGRSEFEDCFYSLRDVDNFPHATFRHLAPEPGWYPDGWTGTLVGAGDTKPVKVEYARRILEWHATLPYPVELDRDNEGWPAEILDEHPPLAEVHDEDDAGSLYEELRAALGDT